MLLCAVLSDTLNLMGPTTTDWDRTMVSAQCTLAAARSSLATRMCHASCAAPICQTDAHARARACPHRGMPTLTRARTDQRVHVPHSYLCGAGRAALRDRGCGGRAAPRIGTVQSQVEAARFALSDAGMQTTPPRPAHRHAQYGLYACVACTPSPSPPLCSRSHFPEPRWRRRAPARGSRMVVCGCMRRGLCPACESPASLVRCSAQRSAKRLTCPCAGLLVVSRAVGQWRFEGVCRVACQRERAGEGGVCSDRDDRRRNHP